VLDLNSFIFASSTQLVCDMGKVLLLDAVYQTSFHFVIHYGWDNHVLGARFIELFSRFVRVGHLRQRPWQLQPPVPCSVLTGPAKRSLSFL